MSKQQKHERIIILQYKNMSEIWLDSLDEPTTGLHFEDIRVLLGVLNRLVDKGNTVIVIEHNLDVIKTADYIIDIGPGGGTAGGEVVFTGTPIEMMEHADTITAKYLRK